MTRDVVLQASGLRRTLQLPGGSQLPILRGVDLTVYAGQSLAIVGRSGSGKTTLLSQLGLLSPLDDGALTILDKKTNELSDSARAALRNASLGYIFQSYSLVPHFTARRNVELPMRYATRVSRLDRKERVSHVLELVGLAERAQSKPRHLPGGEQQRVAIARALVHNPALILADEPTGALDTTTADTVLDILQRATQAQGAALIVVTHDPAIANRMDRRAVMHDGKLTEECG